ncbi:MAG: hypothetical protein HN423_06020, partial [Alphaproteobacteria bacterium]|nr:hypothetical protein [Alphaproteobacteria bacterium]
FEVDKIQVKTLLLAHPGHCLGYRVEYGDRSVCYVTDNELFLPDSDSFDPFYVEKLSNFVRGTDALITDCTYTDAEYETKVGWGHSSIGQVVDLAHNADVKNLYLFHHDPGQTDDDIDRKHETAVEDLAKRNSSTQCLAPSEGDLVRI